MRTTTWLLPWKAKAELLRIIVLLEQRDKGIDSLKGQLHKASTELMEARNSASEWQTTALDHERALGEAVERNTELQNQKETEAMRTLRSQLDEANGKYRQLRKDMVDKDAKMVENEELIAALRKTVKDSHVKSIQSETLAVKVTELEIELVKYKTASIKLSEWIKNVHRLDKPTAEGTIKRLMQEAQNAASMRTRKLQAAQ